MGNNPHAGQTQKQSIDYSYAKKDFDRMVNAPEVDTRMPHGQLPNPEPLLQLFEYKHLPPHLQEVSSLFHGLAWTIAETVPRNAQRTHALNQLILAKDSAVRARVWKDDWKGDRV